jgi:hypothetical protein
MEKGWVKVTPLRYGFSFPAAMRVLFCAEDVLQHLALGRFSSEITVANSQPWQVLRVSACK